MIVTQHLLIKGRVQGVSFRFFTKTEAEKYNISGWVRNLSDGRVEAVAQGESKNFDSFLVKVRRGPLPAKVESIEINKIDLQEQLTEFSIEENSEKTWLEKS